MHELVDDLGPLPWNPIVGRSTVPNRGIELELAPSPRQQRLESPARVHARVDGQCRWRYEARAEPPPAPQLEADRKLAGMFEEELLELLEVPLRHPIQVEHDPQRGRPA